MFQSFGKRRGRKSSPEPTFKDDHIDYDDELGSSKHDKGRRRRRAEEVSPSTPSPSVTKPVRQMMLPTNGGMHSVGSPRVAKKKVLPIYHTPQGVPLNPCNTFLMGGMHYPHKDDKYRRRHHLRKRTIWYRIFCSSSWRMALTLLLVSYVVIWYMLVPILWRVLALGQRFSGNSIGVGALDDVAKLTMPDGSIVSLPSLEEMQQQALRIEEARPPWSSRMKMLERIIPRFIHRNDRHDPPVPNDNKNPEEQLNTEPIGDKTIDLKKERKATAPKPKPMHRENHRYDPPSVPMDNATKDTGSKDSVIHRKNDDKGDVKAPDQTLSLAGIRSEERIRRTLENWDTAPITSSCPAHLDAINTTLLIQCSADRLWIMKETCRRWHQPIVVAVAALDEEVVNLPSSCDRSRVSLLEYRRADANYSYPVNELRNLALDRVNTSHVLMIDVDFVPSMDLDTIIQRELLERESQRAFIPQSFTPFDRDAIVVPAFERLSDCKTTEECSENLKRNSSYLPQDFSDLKTCVRNKECDVFQARDNWEGHHSTRSASWLAKEWYGEERHIADGNVTLRPIKEIDCFDSLRYEPYVVIRWCPPGSNSTNKTRPVAPYYDERFHGYGKNKIQLISHLRFMGYRFSVLPEGFIVHNPHPESAIKVIWNDRQHHNLHAEMDELYPRFLEELLTRYGDRFSTIIKQCSSQKQK